MSTLQTNDVNGSPTRRKDVKRLQRQQKRTERVLQREEQHDEGKQRRAKEKASKQPVRRIFPIWLRIIVVLVLAYLAMISGLMIGYGVLGDGNPTDALELSTWKHIINIVVGEA